MPHSYNTLDHLLEPLDITSESGQAYVDDIKNKPTEQLQDDYLMIWYFAPRDGYGDIKPTITTVRLAIIEELKTRPRISARPRLSLRLPDRITENTPPVINAPPGYGHYD